VTAAFIFFFSKPRKKIEEEPREETIEGFEDIVYEEIDLSSEAKELLVKAKALYDEKKYFQAKKVVLDMITNYPASYEAESVVKFLAEIENSIQAKLLKEDNERHQTKLKKESAIAKAMLYMKDYRFEDEGITYYRDDSSPTNTDTNALFLYFHKKDKIDRAADLRLKVQYQSTKWINISMIEFDVDGKGYQYTPKEIQKGSESNRRYWEWTDETVNRGIYKFVKAVADSEKTAMKLHGKDGQETREILPIEKEAIRNTLKAYEALGGKLDFRH
jgi:hypothetical protein